MSRPVWDRTFGDILQTLTKRSRCLKYKTAAMIVCKTQIMAFGYNGTFAKHKECDDYWRSYHLKKRIATPFDEWIKTREFRELHRDWSRLNEIHAEVNALNWISKRDINDDYVLYTTYSPCDACAKEIISYGIKHIKYEIEYPSGGDALARLRSVGISCDKI